MFPPNQSVVNPPQISQRQEGFEPRREFYTSQLLNISQQPSADEREFLGRWSGLLSSEQRGEWLLSWSRALAAYGTPDSFVGQLEIKLHQFRDIGKTWQAYSREGSNYEMRRALMANQKPYNELVSIELRDPLHLAKSCLLCENILQGLDSREHPEVVPNNFMIDLGNYVVAPNRYPGFPLHMLWLPKNHDDLSNRVAAQTLTDEHDKKVVWLPPEPGKTRGNLVSSSELEALFSFCSSMGFVAVRNHPLSGMSLREHDHWHLIPIECYPKDWHAEISGAAQFSSDVHVFRAHGTPFDIVALRYNNNQELAWETASLINRLELEDQVFSPTYVPNGSGLVLIAPLKKTAVADRYVQLGGAVQEHGFSPMDLEAVQRFDKYVPRRYEYDWAHFGLSGGNSELLDIEYSREEIHQLYRPLNYSKYSEWGDGRYILPELSPICRDVYQALLPFQDMRDDRGHVDTVTFFTLKLADLMKLSAQEKEAVVLAAIFHDSGWDVIPNINVVWNELATRVHNGTAESKAAAEKEMYDLRWGHQARAVERIWELIPSHPFVEQIAEVVGDHDTRQKLPIPIFRAFLDADWLWRVTMTSIFAGSGGSFDRNDSEIVFKRLENAIKPKDVTLKWAHDIARLETTATMLALNSKLSWRTLPEEFLRNYAQEIAVAVT